MENKEVTVVVVNDFDYIQGGATKVALDTAQILYDKNVNVLFFSAVHEDNSLKFRQVSTDQKECLKDGFRGALRGLYNFKAARELKRLLKTLDNTKTIIHVHGWTKALSSSIFRVAGKLNFKVILTLHDYFTACPNGGFFNYKKCEICTKKAMSIDCVKTNCDSRNYMFKMYRVIRQFIQKANIKKCKKLNLINISDFSFEKLKNYFPESINTKKIYNPIVMKKKSRAKVEDNNCYVYIGRISKEKGVDIFCQAIHDLKLKAIIVGDGDQRPILQDKYKNSDIQFVGWKASNEVYDYMRKSKCLVFTSLWYETMGLTILEAISNGVPCIVSKKTAGSEFIQDKKQGLLYNGTLNDLKKKISLYEKSNIKQLSENAYDGYWANSYTEERYLNSILDFYNKI